MTRKFAIGKLTKILICALCLVLLIGTLAYFSDRVTGNATITTMDNAVNIDPDPDPDVDPDDPNKPPYTDPDGDDDDDLTEMWAYLNSRAIVNYNPGDRMDLSFILGNDGALDVKVRETFYITSSVPMTNNAPEFRLYTAVGRDSYGGWQGTASSGVTMTKISDTKYKFTVAESTITAAGTSSKDYFVVFAGSADNDFQGATCKVDYIAEAMQADGEWATAATGSVTIGGNTYSNVVPAA